MGNLAMSLVRQYQRTFADTCRLSLANHERKKYQEIEMKHGAVTYGIS